jgi:glycolate oxidase FAD binding subunit
MEEVLRAASGIIGSAHISSDGEQFAIDGVRPRAICFPGSIGHIAQLLEAAHSNRWAVVPRGGGTHMSVGAPPRRVDMLLCLSRLVSIVEYSPADLTVIAQAGMSISSLQSALAAEGQFLPLDPPFPSSCTVGGAVAVNAGGPLRFSHGTVRDLVLGMKVVLPDGQLVRLGGKVMKNVAGYDLCRLFTGSRGTLGVMCEVAFRVMPVPEMWGLALGRFRSVGDACEAAQDAAASELLPGSLDVLSPGLAGKMLGGSGPYALAVSVAGSRSAVLWQRDRLMKLFQDRKCEAADWAEGEAARDIRQAIADMAAPDGAASFVASALPVETAAFCAGAERLAAEHGFEASFLAHAGNGVVHIYLRGGEARDSMVPLGEELRALARKLGGSMIVAAAPPRLKTHDFVWGPPDDAFRIMSALKKEIDPKGIMSPGRFAGGL